MRLAALLFTQGFGSRRECLALVLAGRVAVGGRIVDDPDAEFEPQGLVFAVDGRAWPWHEKALLLLHKPAGYECSQRPRHHPGVMSLLPAPLRRRGVQPVGRLDEDTTGVLLLTDDGALLHRLTSPKHGVVKVYEVQTRHPLADDTCRRLLEGVVLDDDPRAVRARAAVASGPRTLRLEIAEGRYHQVKRMVAAVGNRVERLHRSAFGAVTLPADLAPGQWCWLDAAVFAPAAPAPCAPPR